MFFQPLWSSLLYWLWWEELCSSKDQIKGLKARCYIVKDQCKNNVNMQTRGRQLNFSASLFKLFILSSPHILLSGHMQFKLTATGSYWSWISTKCLGSSQTKISLKCLWLGIQDWMSQLICTVWGDFPSFPPQLRSLALLSLEWRAFLSPKMAKAKIRATQIPLQKTDRVGPMSLSSC